MARGLVIKEPNGAIRVFVAQQGWVREVENHRVKKAPLGVSRAEVGPGPRMTSVELGKNVPGFKEADRLEALAANKSRARTDKPGVKGYQHMENMANARIANAKAENLGLARVIRQHLELEG